MKYAEYCLGDIIFGHGTTQILKSSWQYEQKMCRKLMNLRAIGDYQYHRERAQVIKDAFDKLEAIEDKYQKVIREPLPIEFL